MLPGQRHQQFSNKVRGYAPDSLIRLIAATAAQRIAHHDEFVRSARRFFKHPEAAFPDFVLAGIVKAAFEIEPRRYYQRDRNPSLQHLGAIQDVFLSCSVDEPMSTKDDLFRFFFRTAFLQFPTQHSSWKLIPRALLIHEKAPQSGGRFDINAAFSDAIGLSVKEFTFIGINLFALALDSRDGVLRVDALPGLGFPALSRDKIRQFLSRTAASFPQLRAWASKSVRIPGYEIYEYNPLVARPIVKLPDGSHSLPVPGLLLERITAGIYYDLAARFGREFQSYLGDAFESYVGRLFEHRNDLEVFGEEEFGPKRHRRKSNDWLVASNGEALLLECKTKRLRIGSATTPHRVQQLADDLKLGMVTGVRQLATTFEAIRSGLVFAGHDSDALYPLLVSMSSCFLFNSDPVRSIVASASGLDPDYFRYQIVGVDEIEDLAALANANDIFEVVRNKVASPDTRQFDLSTQLTGRNEPREHPLLRKTYDDFIAGFRGVSA